MVVLKDLLLDSRDGEWGQGEPGADTVEMSVIRGTDFADARVGDLDDVPVRHLPERLATRKRLLPWDILLETAGGSKDRPTGRSLLLKPSLFRTVARPITCASFARFLRIDPSKAEPRFVFWLLQYLYDANVLRKYHTQHTGVARFQYTTFAEGEPLSIPERGVQRRIADILSAYDDLIENNTRRIRILEEMARSLYREWFVEFRFPGRDKSRLVRRGEDQHPAGWATETLGSAASFISRGVSPKYADDGAELVVNQKCIRDQRLSLEPARRHVTNVPADKYVRAFDVLINSTGVGTLGRVAQVLHDLDACTVDTHVSIVRPGPAVSPHFWGHALMAKESYFEAQGAGATGQTELARTRIAETTILLPSRELQSKFDELVAPWREAAEVLRAKQRVLQTTRDLLLQRLISGELQLAPEQPRG